MEYPTSFTRYLDQGRQIFTDTRQVIQDGVFLALHGNQFDGNKFAMEALEKGAAFAIVDRIIQNDPRLILVKDTLDELQLMANLNRTINKAKIIAITGTNGKTTTKELTFSIFQLASNCIATKGNLNNHIGVPLTLLKIDKETDYAIIEMGANRPGDILTLCKIAMPDIGLITNIGKAHLEGFVNIDGVEKTKMELFNYLMAHHGIRLYNFCSERIKRNYVPDSTSISFGNFGDRVNYYGTLTHSFPSIEMTFSDNKEEIVLHSNLFGEYNYQNILASSTIARVCDIPSANIIKGIGAYVPGNLRSQIIQKEGTTIVMDAYNANPSSMYEAIDTFNQMHSNPKWIILGEMAELGTYKESEHDELIKFVLTKNFDNIIVVGKLYNSYRNTSGIQVFEDVIHCKNWLDKNWPQQTAVFIKGSRSSYLEKLMH